MGFPNTLLPTTFPIWPQLRARSFWFGEEGDRAAHREQRAESGLLQKPSDVPPANPLMAVLGRREDRRWGLGRVWMKNPEQLGETVHRGLEPSVQPHMWGTAPTLMA